MKLRARKALLLSAHADDAEFGCGGVVQKLIASDVAVTSVVFSICEDAVDSSIYQKDIRKIECKKAAKILGINDLRFMEYPVRRFPSYRQEILQDLVDLRYEANYDLVFTHWYDDVHQDHAIVAAESFRAFKGTEATLVSYEVPLDCQAFSPNIFVPLTEDEVEKKIQSIWAYESEVSRREYFSKSSLRASMGYRGPFAQSEYAEAFELRIMIVDDINHDSS